MILRSSAITATLLICLATTFLSAQGGPPAATIGFATYIGSTGQDSITSLEMDASGAVYIAGGMPFDAAGIWASTYTSFGQGPANSPQCYFAKLVADGSGGLTYEYVAVIRDGFGCGVMAVAPNGDVAIAGSVSVLNSVVRLFSNRTPGGDLIQTASFAVPLQTVDHLRLDDSGRTYAAGLCAQEVTPGSLWPLANGAQPDPTPGLCTNPSATGGIDSQETLVVADSNGEITYGTFLGTGAGELDVTALEVDGTGRIWVAGHTIDGLVDVTPDAYQPDPAGASDAFLALIDPALSASSSLVYASYFGGSGVERDISMAVNPTGSVYLAGNTETRAGFPGRDFADPAIFLSVLDLSQPPASQLLSTAAIVESPLTSLYSNFETTTAMRLLPNGSIAFLADSIDSQFPLVQPLYSGPYDPANPNPLRPLLLVYDPAAGVFTFATFLDDVQQARFPRVAAGPGSELYVGMTTPEAGRSTDGSAPLGLEDTLLFAVSPDSPNRPPTVSIFENLTTVYADSPSAGALLQLNSIASDPDGDTLTYSWTGPFIDSPATTNPFLVARVPLGMQQTVTVTVDDGHGNVVSASRTFDVVGTPFVGTTATPVDSQINGLVFNYAPVTITASAIGAGGGSAYLRTRLDQNPPIPADLQAGSPPIYFELSTDATLTSPIQVCIDTRGMSFANPGGVRLYQYQQSSWTDVTSPGYPQGNQLCGQSSTLGTFAIFYAQVPATAVQTVAGNGVLAGSNDGAGGNPIDDVIDGPARQTALPNLFGGAYDRANNRLFVSGGSSIFQVNLSDDTIIRVGGNDVGFPMELTVAPGGDVVFIDRNTCTVRSIDLAQGSLHPVAGNGTCGFSGDGGPATLAAISPGAMAFDSSGNLFIADPYAASIRRIDAATGIIDTVAGDGTFAVPITGAPAHSAIGLPAGLAFDAQGHLIVAAGMHLIRISTGAADALIDGDADEVISVLGGCNTNCQAPYNGDGLAISHPQVYLPGLGHVTVARDGAVIFVDYFRIRRIAPGADGIVTGASDEIVSTVGGYYDWEALSLIPNFNGDTFSTQSLFGPPQFAADDTQGRIVVVDGNNFRVRRFGLASAVIDHPVIQINVAEPVFVVDSVSVRPSRIIELVETVTVQDGPSVQSAPINTPPVAVLDVAPHLVAGQGLTLSGARSTDANGTITTYRWAVPDAGVAVDTTTPTYVVPAADLAALSAGSHAVTLVVSDNSGNQSAAATQTVEVIQQQQVLPVFEGRSPGAIQTIASGQADQNDPHVHKDLMAFTENSGTSSRIRSFDFSTGTGAAIPQPPGNRDLLSDVNSNRIAFVRVMSDRTGVMLFDPPTGSTTEIDPRPGVNRFGTGIGSNTLVFPDLLAGNGNVVSYDLSTGTTTPVSESPDSERDPEVSPDGTVVVWTREAGSSSDVYKAVRVQGVWNVSPAAATSALEVGPDSDGTWIVYSRLGANGYSVFYRRVTGGEEFGIGGFAEQENPAISEGVISFRGRRTAADSIDLFVYEIASNRLYQVTANADIEGISDVSVLDNGDVRVVWAAAPAGIFSFHSVYATTFSMLPLPTVTVAPASGAAGESITLSATLTSEAAPVADALMEFQVGGAVALVRTGANGVATVTWTIGVNPGTYPDGIRVNFPGDPARRLAPASGSATLTVSRASTALALTTTPDPVVVASPLTATAFVSSSFGIPGGDVSFTERDGTTVTPLGTVPLDASGAAAPVLSGLSAGGHVICAEYAGSTIHTGSLDCSRVTVTKASAPTTLSSSRNPSLSTGPPVFIATIQAAADVRPTGKVEFFANGTLLCRSTVHTIAGVRTQASCGGAPLTIGTHVITATYTGDANFDASSAAALTQTVQPGGYIALDLGFDGEAVALSPNGWVTGNSQVKSALSTTNIVNAYVHDGTTLGVPQMIPSLGGTKTMAVGVDDSGRVGGSSTTTSGETHVFFFDGTTTHDHHNPAFGGANSRAMAMNSSGAIVGIADTATAFRAFVDLRGGAFDLGTITGGTHSAAFATSEPVFGTSGLGHIAGISTVAGGAGRAALFGGATVIDLGTLGGTGSGASAVNRAGESAGFSDVAGGARRAFIHRDGVMLDIGATLGSSLSLATAINDAGQVVGTYEDTSSGTPVSRAFLYSLDTTTDLGLGTFAALNNAGVVVQNGTNGIAIRTGGGVLTIAPASGGTASHQLGEMVANAINDDGRIAGYIAGPNGPPRATVWIPVPLSSLTVDAASAPSGGMVSLSATLTSQGAGVANKSIRFMLEGADAGTAVTDAAGRATLTAILPALAEGVYPEGIRALFTGDETLGGAVAVAALTVEAAASDLSIAATASAATVDAGGTVRYTVTVTNNGPSPASDVSINVSAPASLVLGATNAPGGPCLGSPFGGSLDCFVLAPIPALGQYVLTIDARPTAVGSVSATFVVTASSSDPAPANNQASVTVNVSPATDLAITVLPSRTLLSVGESLTYAVTVRNNGPVTAPSAGVTITGDLGYTIDEITLPGLSCTTVLFSRTWTCGLGAIAPGATVQFSVNGRVTGSSPGTNTFAVGSAVPDPNPSNNTVVSGFDARPTVTINQAVGQTDPATVAPVNFTVVFSEPVTGFDAADVSFAGSTVGGTLSAAVTGSGATYTVAVSGMSGLGLVAVSIPAGAAVDGGGNPSAASTSTDRTVLYGLSSVLAYVSSGNGGNASLTLLNFGGQLTGILFYSRGPIWLAATRFTSLVISGQSATVDGFTTSNRHFSISVRDGGSGQADTFRLWLDGVEQTAGGAVSSGTVTVTPWAPDTRLKGWVDLHTHPMSNLAFGGKLFHGAPSVGSLMPAVQMPNDPECRFDQRATSIAEALSQDGPTRGDPIQSRCGDSGRNLIVKTLESFNDALVAPAGADGFPAFTHWPKWNDITHQKMWIDWIRRSWEGGQRVMVALSHNNRALAGLLGAGGPISGVRTDAASSDLQIEEIKRLVADHPDFMAVATTPAELHAIVQGGRLAVVLGVEIDKIGDFSTSAPPSQQTVDDEIGRLYAQGVRYVLPIHFVDNAFGDSAVHQPLFNALNFHENQTLFSVGCAQLSDGIGFQSTTLPAILAPFMLGGMPALFAPSCLQGATFLGHVNTRLTNGLTTTGEFAIRAMMRRGMIVDIDHMSNRAANRTLAIANGIAGGGYPVTSGHAGIRDRNSSLFNAENSRTTGQLARIACLGGMFGLGTDTAGGHRWAAQYELGYNAMRRAFAPNGLCPGATPLGGSFIALGTDANSLVKTPVPPMLDPVGPVRFADIYNPANPLNVGVGPLSRSTTGSKTWDYNFDGVAHYGMYVDFLRDVRTWNPAGTLPGRQMVDDQMMYGADYFYRMWLKADAQKVRIP